MPRNGRPIVYARCDRCGREFYTDEFPDTDPYLPQNAPGWSRDDAQPCGGTVSPEAHRSQRALRKRPKSRAAPLRG